MTTPTTQSSSDAYATPSDMVAYHDGRVLQQLCSDNNVQLTPTQLLTSPRLLKILKAASGEVEAACMVAGAYTPEDLQVLFGTVSGEYLAAVVCDIALARLWRPDMNAPIPKSVEDARETLELLRKGQRVFGLVAQQDAGRLSDVVETAIDVDNRHGVAEVCARLFGRRVNRLQGP